MAYPFDGSVNDLTNHSFQFLNVKELSIAAKVCKAWNSMANNKSHWESLLGKITQYRNVNEHPKQTYIKINHYMNVALSTREVQKNEEYAKILLQTPSLASKLNPNMVGIIAGTYSHLIKVISEYTCLRDSLQKYIQTFLNVDTQSKMGVYHNLLKLIHDNNIDLLNIIDQDANLASLFKNQTFPDPSTPLAPAFIG